MTFQELWNELEQEDPAFIRARKKAQIQVKLSRVQIQNPIIFQEDNPWMNLY